MSQKIKYGKLDRGQKRVTYLESACHAPCVLKISFILK